MSGTVRGSIEHLFLGTGEGTGSTQVAFVNAYNFLNNNTGTLGIRRIAYNTGSQNTGMEDQRGMSYYDQPNPAGDNAWATFCFSSSSIPFYVHIQWAGNANAIGTAPGSPCLFEGSATTTVFGISIAQRVDGGNPWNGTSGNLGYDDKGSPVWHPSTSTCVYYPRSNDIVRGGTFGTLRENTMGFAISVGADHRMHQVADYDNYAILFDNANDNSYHAMIFGLYTPLSGVSAQVPYFCFEGEIPFLIATKYGAEASTTGYEGGTSYPTVATSGSVCVGIDRYTTSFFQNTQAQPNRAYATPSYDEFPLLIGLFEPNDQVGVLGQSYNFYRESYNVSTHDTNTQGTRAAFGTAVQATVKLTVPWHSGTVPGSGVTRAGIQF